MTMKELPPRGLVGENTLLSDTVLGRYTEVGMGNFLENTRLGDYSYTGPHCIIQNAQIGRFSNIAALVRIGPTNHPMDRPAQHHFTYRRTLYGFDSADDGDFFQWRRDRVARIGHDTWLGHGAILMSGVSLGVGAVIGSGSVVTKNVPDYAVAVGNPARVIRYRFPEEVREALKRIAWWDWSHEEIKEAIMDFTGPVEKFIEKYEGRRRGK